MNLDSIIYFGAMSASGLAIGASVFYGFAPINAGRDRQAAVILAVVGLGLIGLAIAIKALL